MYDFKARIKESIEWGQINLNKRDLMDEIREAIEIGDITTAIELVKEWGVYEDELEQEIKRLNN